MKTNILLIAAIAVATTFGAAATFDKIPFSQPTYSENDPLGVAALTNVEAKVSQLESKDLTTDIANEVKNQLTNNTDVVIGQVTGTSDDIGFVAKNKSIILAVNRDMEEIEATEGSITFAADKIQLGALDSIYVGNQTLQALLATAGGQNGDMNIIEEIQVNGVKVNPENKVVNLTIPSISGLAIASEVESTYAKKTEIPSLDGYAKTNDIPSLANYALKSEIPDISNLASKSEIPSLDGYAKTSDIPSVSGLASKQYVDDELTNYVKLAELQDGIQFNTLEAKSFKIDGKDVSVVGHKHDASDITNLTETITSQMTGVASETFVTNKLDGYIKKSDVSSAASTAIAGINGATTIEEIQVALTNFLHTLVITPAP